ncbi:hypothetical protein A3C20_01745 [Candidatus Kaiserbacteria bacterium RIFCSPHIGHO2_02_FULL_55_25]|uniref:Uncharacterized protein n=1 Tax=Candidatus Kaiserbacteria bacterium RIFCSPHIGHO2_02_FULL_55_25 TaxID=1798498 RepID=A0A1F6E5N3_9BACT|nr:MAG: hypothetical protein A3C20_01745 [Candidatus Kaiserbacteria bacterium RIFCSPHIGHO2_02_FULL_55_25]OGG78243.1 MAG: hypothetical protein A3F56_04220 [Candidatus Kaiserbacteria bacterium RIFCSPHIGHO2_12_FULL_55_13]OGG84152.1 MAG: hypothetical protein A3A42_02055 [Candidatus Kaiserbacteria bacterium RIFCSPLOWO2_01_FULL_55_25]
MRYYFVFHRPPEDPNIAHEFKTMLLAMARKPIEDSFFYVMTKDIQSIADDREFLARLECRGYDAGIAEEDGKVRSVIAFQRHWLELHCFHYQSFRPGQRITSALLGEVMRLAWDTQAKHVLIWGGNQLGKLSPENEAAMRALYKKTVEGRLGLDFPVRAGLLEGEAILG